MATLLLDTSVIIDAINEKKNRRQFLRDLVQQGNVLACCPINVTEIYAGMRPKEEVQTTRFLTSLDYHPITFAVARLAGEMKRDFRKKGPTLSVTDSLIAAVAIQYQLPLITDNVKDFPMKDLQLYPLPEQ
jgi:predicted nucleic acid-binding protein